MDFLPFSRPSLDEQDIQAVVNCLHSGWLATGPKVQDFSDALKAYFDAPFALPLTSCTAALHLSLLALELKPGDEVITTPLTFIATLNTIVHAGGKPVLVDIDPTTWNLDLQQLAGAITPKTRALLPVHFAGLPVDLDPVYTLAEKHSLRVIEDAAHAAGACYKNRRIGSFGDTQVFSFHPNKNMTSGEGGCVVTRDPKLAQFVELARFHGIDRGDAWNRFSKNGSQHYAVIMPGFKYNMMDMQAVLGLTQLPKLETFNERRRQLAIRYQQAFNNWPMLTLPQTPSYDHLHSWHLYTVLVNSDASPCDRDAFMEQMKTHNIGTGLHYLAAHLHPYYQTQYGYRPGDFPIAENVCDRIVSLPLFQSMTDAEQDHVIEIMAHILGA